MASACGGIGDDQVGDGVQGVEQEMRIDLRAQRVELGFGELLQEQGLAGLASSQAASPCSCRPTQASRFRW